MKEHVILACGCKVQDMDEATSVFIKDYDKDGNRAIGLINCCAKCLKYYEFIGATLETDEEIDKWYGDERCLELTKEKDVHVRKPRKRH